ncbi:MAG: hypothetical protein C0467_29680 [Planctomycetaceae bacterium]|nr:hypothetical protein [Planctomycetaceae bacterium]
MFALPDLNDEQWTEIVERLTHHGACHIVRHTWRGLRLAQGGSVPGGVDPADLAADAITDVIEGRRIWNQVTYPVFLDFLRSVVDSRVSHLVESAENRLTRRMPAPTDDGNADLDVAAHDPDPADVCRDRDSLENFRDTLVKEIGDDPLVAGLFSCIESGDTRPEDIALLLDVKVKDVNNAQKRLRRKAAVVIKTSQPK